MQFQDWVVDFEAYIKEEGIQGEDRVRHLKTFVGGETKTAIEGFLILSTNDSYPEARKMLKERYGNRHEISRSFRTKLDNWPRVGNGNGKELRDFGDFLAHIHGAISSTPN